MTDIIVGAGIIGATLALELRRRGRDVLLIDRDAPGMGASFGNLASIAVTEFMPASRPDVWRRIPGWLLDPGGPIRIAPAHMPRLVPWFARFLLASRPRALARIEGAGAALCARALGDTQALLEYLGASEEITAEGCIRLYADDAEFAADRDNVALLDRYGIAHDILPEGAAQELEPALSPGIRRALLLPDNRSLRDPHRYAALVVARFAAMGGRVMRAEVSRIARAGHVRGVRLSDGTLIRGETATLAAGAFTADLAARAGEPIPLETERGYHTQVMDPGIGLRHALIWPARAFMVTPTAGGLRIGGTVEMAGLRAAPDWRRAQITARRAGEALPGLTLRETSEWMGHRPALPDTIPILSASARTRGLFYSTGHGHLGVTNAATSARLMAALIAGETPALDLSPFRIDRF